MGDDSQILMIIGDGFECQDYEFIFFVVKYLIDFMQKIP